MHLRTALALVPLLLVLFAGVPRGALAADPAAAAPVEQLEIALKAVLLEGGDLDFRARYGRLAAPVKRTHDVDRMAASRLDGSWARLSDDQRAQLKDLLFKRLVATYALRFDGKQALAIDRGPPTDAADGAALVELRAAQALLVAFLVEPGPEGWRVTDVRWGGSSTVDADRTEAARILAADGFAALLARWKEKVPLPQAAPGDGSDSASKATPREVVEHLQEGIVLIMKEAKTLGFRERYARFEKLVDETHFLPGIAQLTLGPQHWTRLASEEKQRFVERFRRYSIGRYASRFDGYSGERFETLEDREQRGGYLVRSVLIKADGERITFDWTLREIAGRWQILNITVDGVSDLATKQAEYKEILDRQGFDALLSKVDEQIAKQESGA